MEKNCKTKFKRKKFTKTTNLDKIKLFKIIQKLQNQISNLDTNSVSSIFLWETATIKSVEIDSNSNFYIWLFPIKFSSSLAIILEILQNNIFYILEDREKAFELISSQLNIEKNYFYLLIKCIQILLIKSGKVKVCKNGKVIIMCDIGDNINDYK